MKAKNTRYLDAQGRIILPNHIRKELNLKAGSAVDVDLEEDGTIRIRPSEVRCVICGENHGDCIKIEVGPHAIHVCRNCRKLIVSAI